MDSDLDYALCRTCGYNWTPSIEPDWNGNTYPRESPEPEEERDQRWRRPGTLEAPDEVLAYWQNARASSYAADDEEDEEDEDNEEEDADDWMFDDEPDTADDWDEDEDWTDIDDIWDDEDE